MKNTFSLPSSALRGAFAAVALSTASAAGWAVDLPNFTYNPSALGGSNVAVTADNFLVSDYSTVSITGATFSESGFLAIDRLTLDGQAVTSDGGLNSSYGLYVAYTANGQLTGSAGGFTFGTISSLNYTLYGYTGGALTFGANASGQTTITGGAPASQVALATGALPAGTQGYVATYPNGTATAGTDATFALTGTGSTVFTLPNPFYTMAQTTFTGSNITPTATGFRITQGGGTLNFVSAVPEPETYAMLLAGLAAIGFVAKRRKH